MASESEPDPVPAPDPELCWLALCYVAGEMGSDEVEAFEARLDRDQAAREAVAEAVALAGAIARIEPAPRQVLPLPCSGNLPLRLPRRTAVAGAGLAAGLAAAACLGWLLVDLGDRAPAPTAPRAEVAVHDEKPVATDHPSLALPLPLAWSRLRAEGIGPREEGLGGELLAWNDEVPALPGVDCPAHDEGEGGGEADEASDPALPLWLLDAASLAGQSEPVMNPPTVEEP